MKPEIVATLLAAVITALSTLFSARATIIAAKIQRGATTTSAPPGKWLRRWLTWRSGWVLLVCVLATFFAYSGSSWFRCIAIGAVGLGAVASLYGDPVDEEDTESLSALIAIAGVSAILIVSGFVSRKINQVPDKAKQFEIVLRHFCNGDESMGYRVRPLPFPEWIKGKQGTYTEVGLIVQGKPLLFDPTEYKVPFSQSSRFDQSVSAFVKEIVWPLKDLKFPSTIYVRGSADKPKFRPKIVDPKFAGSIRLVRALSPTQYSPVNDTITVAVGETYVNEQLPALRANFLRWILAGPSYSVESVMLDGTVEPKEGTELRNAVIVVYVEYPLWVTEKYGLSPCAASVAR